MSLISQSKCLLRRKFLYQSRRLQHGYIVLIPELGEDAPDGNPLYRNDGLPEFNEITIEHCRAAIAHQTVDFETRVKDVENKIDESTPQQIFKEVFEPLEKFGASLDVTWGLSKTLYLGNNSKVPSASYMAIHERASWARASKYNSKSIYESVKSAIQNKVAKKSEENRILQKFAVEGKLNGLELDNKNKELFTGVLNRINKEKSEVKRKLDYVTQHFAHRVGDSRITREFPEFLLKATSYDPKNYLKGPWKMSLQPHLYNPIMEHCSDREIRWNMWQALVNRGTTNSETATSLHIEEIRISRREVAKLLGYDTFANMSMETKMAGKVQEVHNMISNLLKHAKVAQEEEVNNLYNFAVERGFTYEALELWDLPYWRRKQLHSLYNYSETDFKDYFSLNTVLDGLFKLCEKLFGIQIRQRKDVSAWHKDVKFYDIFDPNSSAPLGGFYLDPYDSSLKKNAPYSKGWMVAIQNKSDIINRKPLCALIFQFDPPSEEKPSHLTYREVKNLFHNFGYALQHMLTQTKYSELAGVSNIEWDTVQMSGYVLSHWLSTKPVIDSISSHFNTKESLPQEMFETLLKMDKHMAGLDLCRELYLSTLDLELHSTRDFWLEVMRRLWPEFQNFKLHKADIHPCSFTEVFVEGWGAAYYCHTWSKMIAADIYSAFHEVQENEEEISNIGRRYRDTFLSLGGSVHPSQIFREFRGRDPCPKALLRSLGIKLLK